MTQTTDIIKREDAALARTYTMDDMLAFAENAAKSNLFGCKTKEQALTLMLLAQSEGKHPIQALREYHIIQGRPTMRADAAQARFIDRGGKILWIKRDEQEAEAEFYAAGLVKPVRVRWNMKDANKAGLSGKDNWRQYPRQMLANRVMMEGIRAADPGAIVGLYAEDEIEMAAPEVPQENKADAIVEQLQTDTVEGEVIDPKPTPEQIAEYNAALDEAKALKCVDLEKLSLMFEQVPARGPEEVPAATLALWTNMLRDKAKKARKV